MKLIKLIFLYPVSVLYGFVVKFRNFLFDIGILKSVEFKTPVVVVGNLSAGGTGKTPATEYLIRLLRENKKTAVLSRGYKRKTKGFIIADDKSVPEKIGDEPYQIYKKFKNITVAVDEKRVRGIKKLLETENKPDVILLDDAFQHRYVKPALSVLLTDYTKPFYNDFYLPYGRLRDNPEERFRAEIVIMTKTPPDVKPIDMRIAATNLKLKPYQSLFFAGIKYGKPKPVFNPGNISFDEKDFCALVVAGVANPQPFFDFAKEKFKDVKFLRFKDHVWYSVKETDKIIKEFDKINNRKTIIVTTEKDAVKLKQNEKSVSRIKDKMFFYPIEMNILNDEKNIFDKQILKLIEQTDAQYRFLIPK